MIKYYAWHRSLFDKTNHGFIIAFMKLCGALFTEVVNILLICNQKTIMECVMNFIALGVIAEVDDLYAQSLRNVRISEALEEDKLPKVYKGGTKNFEKTLFIYFQRLIFWIGKFFFVVIYYYFMPFMTVVMSQQLGGKPSPEYMVQHALER
jgi:hypothetical protein